MIMFDARNHHVHKVADVDVGEKLDIPACAVVLWCALSWAAGTAWMLRWDMVLSDALFGGALAAAAGNVALLLLVPILGLTVIPALTVVAIVVQASLIVAAAC